MMNPTSNKKDFEDLSTTLKDLAYSYIEKYSPSKQQLKVFLMKKILIKFFTIMASKLYLILLIINYLYPLKLKKNYLN